MKKNILIIIGIIIVAITGLLIIFLNRTTYYIKVNKVDDYSPDRILEVYNNKNEKVEVKRIEYLDGTLLCNGYNMAVHFGDIERENEFIIILNDNSNVKAKIIKEEVKNR